MKKMFCILSTLSILLTTIPVISASAEESATVIAGDVNQSGDVNILDLIYVNKAILGCMKLSDEQIQAADFNHNQELDSDDSLLLLKYIVGENDVTSSGEPENTVRLDAASTVVAKTVVPDSIPGFDMKVTSVHNEENNAEYQQYDITAVPDADVPVDYSTHYAPAWMPEGMMCRSEQYDYDADDPKNGQINKYIKAYTQVKWNPVGFCYEGTDYLREELYDPAYENYDPYYVLNQIQPHEFRFEQQTEADFSQTLNGQPSDSVGEITNILTINGNPGYCTRTDTYEEGVLISSTYRLIWKQDGYVMLVEGGSALSQEDMIRVAESVAPEKRILPSTATSSDASPFKTVLNDYHEHVYDLATDEMYETDVINTFADITVDPVADAPTDYDRIFRIGSLPENMHLMSSEDHFTYSEGGQDGDICARSTHYWVMTEKGQKSIRFGMQTQKDFFFTYKVEGYDTLQYEQLPITINGNPGFCWHIINIGRDGKKSDTYVLFWMQDGYVMNLSDNFQLPLETITKIAESISEVQIG